MALVYRSDGAEQTIAPSSFSGLRTMRDENTRHSAKGTVVAVSRIERETRGL